MIIEKNLNWLGEDSYRIIIKENLIPEEIARCFTLQYPNKKAVLTSREQTKKGIQINIMILGIIFNDYNEQEQKFEADLK